MEDSSAYIGAWASRQVTRIFVQYRLREELSGTLGCLRCDGTSVNPSKSAPSVGPVAGIVVRWIGHAQSGSQGRKNQRWRPKCLVRVDSELIVQSQPHIRHRRRYGTHWSQSVLIFWRVLGLFFLRCSILCAQK